MRKVDSGCSMRIEDGDRAEENREDTYAKLEEAAGHLQLVANRTLIDRGSTNVKSKTVEEMRR